MNFNKVLVGGRLTRDPELRYTPSGTAVSDLSVAVNRKYGDKEETLFLDVTVWDKQAETCCQYLTKGREIFVEGYLRMESWDSPDGKRTKIKVVAERVQFIGQNSKKESSGEEAQVTSGPGPVQDDEDDDIPF